MCTKAGAVQNPADRKHVVVELQEKACLEGVKSWSWEGDEGAQLESTVLGQMVCQISFCFGQTHWGSTCWSGSIGSSFAVLRLLTWGQENCWRKSCRCWAGQEFTPQQLHLATPVQLDLHPQTPSHHNRTSQASQGPSVTPWRQWDNH